MTYHLVRSSSGASNSSCHTKDIFLYSTLLDVSLAVGFFFWQEGRKATRQKVKMVFTVYIPFKGDFVTRILVVTMGAD